MLRSPALVFDKTAASALAADRLSCIAASRRRVLPYAPSASHYDARALVGMARRRVLARLRWQSACRRNNLVALGTQRIGRSVWGRRNRIDDRGRCVWDSLSTDRPNQALQLTRRFRARFGLLPPAATILGAIRPLEGGPLSFGVRRLGVSIACPRLIDLSLP